MQKILTVEIWESLVALGYHYCLSRTSVVSRLDVDSFITLVPVKETPLLETLPAKYDTFFEIEEEPRQMAYGVGGVIILIDLKNIEIEHDPVPR